MQRLPLSLIRELAPSVLATSPAVRAVATARYLANELSFKKALSVRPETVEVNFGELEGMVRKDIPTSRLSDVYAGWQVKSRDRLPGGESWSELGERAHNFLSWAQQHEDNIVLVSHSYFIRSVISEAAGGWPPVHAAFIKLRNCSMTQLSWGGVGWSLDSINLVACNSIETAPSHDQ